jgi:two-component system phosphate regulon sensor histidine kinase PhoR
MEWIRKSFARRVVFAYSVIFALIFLLAGLFLENRLENQSLRNLKENLITETRLLSRLFSGIPFQNADLPALQNTCLGLKKDSQTRVTLVDASGKVLADSSETLEEVSKMENHKNRPEIRTALEGGIGYEVRYSDTLRRKMLYAAVPVYQKREIVGAVRTSVSLDHVAWILSAIRHPLLACLGGGIVLILVAGLLLGSYMSRRISHLAKGAARYAQGHLEKKIYTPERDELRALAEAMNAMALSLNTKIKELKNENNRVSGILENLEEGVLAVDGHRRVLAINRSAQRMFALDRETALGKSLLEIVRAETFDAALAQAMNDKKTVMAETRIGFPSRLHLKGVAIGLLAEKIEGAVAGILVLHDMTEIRKLEDLRRDFVANVSHELRTPLTSIKGFVETLLGGALKDSKRSEEFLRIMEEDAVRLTRLIDDLLELSRIESGQVPLKREKFDPAEEIEKVLLIFRPKIAEKKLNVAKQVDSPGGARFVWADRDQIRQVLINLIDNAVKFNKTEGQIFIHAVREDNRVKITIRDSGIGIPREAQPRIFERFFRVDKARSRSLGGTGLGLAIVKHIVEAHGGAVACISEHEKGSEFSFTLPIA